MSIETQLRDYRAHFEAELSEVPLADVPKPAPLRTAATTVRLRGARWAAAVAAGFATLLLVGAAALLFRSDAGDPVAPSTTAETPTTQVPEVAPTTEAPVTTTLGPPATAPFALVFDEVLDGERMATGPTIAIGPDGLPVIWYWAQDPEVFFGDAIGPSGMRIVRCADAACGDYEIIDASSEVSAMSLAAFLPDGAPVFVEAEGFPGATEGTGMIDGLAELHVCSDALCSEVETTVLESVDYRDLIVNFPRVVGGGSGTPVLYFQSDAPPATPSVKVMSCEDRACSNGTVTTLSDDAWGPEPYVTEAGALVLLYRQDLSNNWLAMSCDELDCSDGATAIPVDEALGLIRPTPVVWGGGPDDEGIEVCFGPACTAIEGVHGDGFEVVMGPDGALLVVYAPFGDDGELKSLMVMTCADLACATTTSVEVASLITDENLALGRWAHGADPSVMIGDDGLPLVAYGTIEGLHLIRCEDLACTPPRDG